MALKLIICLTGVVFFQFLTSMAHASCIGVPVRSIKTAFYDAEVVFTAIAKDNQTLVLNRLYKPPTSPFKNDENINFRLKSGATSKLEEGNEYIIFAEYERHEGRDFVYPRSCDSKAGLTPKKYLDEIRGAEKIHGVLVFTGTITNIDQKPFENRRSEIVNKQYLDFEVRELLKNETSKPELKDPKAVKVVTWSCDEFLQVGEDYLIHASYGGVAKRNSDGLYNRELSASCNTADMKYLNLLDKLESLSLLRSE